MAQPIIWDILIKARDASIVNAHQGYLQEINHIASDWSAHIPQTSIPIIYIQGDAESSFPAISVKDYFADHQNVETIEIPQAGQLLFYKNCDAVFQHLP